jgi:hypothetical protein
MALIMTMSRMTETDPQGTRLLYAGNDVRMSQRVFCPRMSGSRPVQSWADPRCGGSEPPQFRNRDESDMRLLKPSQSETPRSGLYQVFRSPEEEFADETHRIGLLIDTWLKSQNESRPNAQAASRVERKLHDAIKGGPLYGKILSFAGLNLWVDDRTSDGLVMMQESISI